MESNGQRNCIHVSEATADLLRTRGKGQWLTKRRDMVDAKGKGKDELNLFINSMIYSYVVGSLSHIA
jgi:hypothetical protein